MTPPRSLRVCCPHLDSSEKGLSLLGRWAGRWVEVRLDGGDARVIVCLCSECAARLGADDGRSDSLRLAALIVLHRNLHARLTAVVEALREIAPLSAHSKL